jgi:hypothetical protein
LLFFESEALFCHGALLFDFPDGFMRKGGWAMQHVLSSDWNKQWTKLIARAWADEAFKRRLLASPAAVLQECGLAVPPGVQVKVVENSDQVLHLMLPPRPVGELTEEELEQVAAGLGSGDDSMTVMRR